jgi:hypothetical protein
MDSAGDVDDGDVVPGHVHFLHPSKEDIESAESRKVSAEVAAAESAASLSEKALRSAMDKVGKSVKRVLRDVNATVFDSVSQFCTAAGSQRYGRMSFQDHLPVATIAMSLNWTDNKIVLDCMARRLRRDK